MLGCKRCEPEPQAASASAISARGTSASEACRQVGVVHDQPPPTRSLRLRLVPNSSLPGEKQYLLEEEADVGISEPIVCHPRSLVSEVSLARWEYVGVAFSTETEYDSDRLDDLFDRFDVSCKDNRVASTISALRHCLSHGSLDTVLEASALLRAIEGEASGRELEYSFDDVLITVSRILSHDGVQALEYCLRLYWASPCDVDEWLVVKEALRAILSRASRPGGPG